MDAKEMVKRYLVFLLGILISATGIAFITRAGLGTSALSSIPFVLSLITPVSMGVFTFISNMTFLLLEVLVVRKFTWKQALQIPATLVLSGWIDVAMYVIPTNYQGPYGISVLYLLTGCILMGVGISFEVMGDVSMLPGEAFIRALARKLKKEFGNVQVCVESTLTAVALIIALISFHKLNGVREGTIFSALVVGQLVKLFTRHMGWVKKFWEKKATKA